MTKLRSRFAALALLVPLAVAGCGDGGGGNPFRNCGDGIVEGSEQCDDGNTQAEGSRDNDGCLSTCVLAQCGDGFLYTGVEECDPGMVEQDSCREAGRSGDGIVICSDTCRIDGCGPVFTPTPTSTPTSTSTRTPTPTEQVGPTQTPTPTPRSVCGDGVIEGDETCDDENTEDGDSCPSDCQILPCDPAGTTRAVIVSFAAPAGEVATSATLRVGYPDGTVGIPGSGLEASVRGRVFLGTCESTPTQLCERSQDCPGGETCVRARASVNVNDLDYALRVVYNLNEGIPDDRLFAVDFDDCADALPPESEAFSCTVEGCAGAFGTVEGCTCTAELP